MAHVDARNAGRDLGRVKILASNGYPQEDEAGGIRTEETVVLFFSAEEVQCESLGILYIGNRWNLPRSLLIVHCLRERTRGRKITRSARCDQKMRGFRFAAVSMGVDKFVE